MPYRLFIVPLLALIAAAPAAQSQDTEDPAQAPIDRKALVDRHAPRITAPDPMAAFPVGNGDFAFSTDITGLQTFYDSHQTGVPLGTMSHWGWHEHPVDPKPTLEDVLVPYDSHGRRVWYPGAPEGDEPAPEDQAHADAAHWLKNNPHRIHLGRLGFVLREGERTVAIAPEAIANAEQTLDLWSGTINSHFTIAEKPVTVTTVCHPDRDAVAVHIESPLLADGKLGVALMFPYAAGGWRQAAEWEAPDKHTTAIAKETDGWAFVRTLDATTYHARLAWPTGDADAQEAGPHRVEVFGTADAEVLDLELAFSPEPIDTPAAPAQETQAAAAAHWEAFWQSGGAIDLSESSDPRWEELERRIVLSQYLLALHSAGTLPPAETGLVMNSWVGMFHLEMHWWHGVHFALWDRLPLLERSLPWYEEILPQARRLAHIEGYRGARWPKQTNPEGREAPSNIGSYLIWQQPHPIYYAELVWRQEPTQETLERFRDIVMETATFMADFAAWDYNEQRYDLGPPVIPAQEGYWKDRARLKNPTYELAYWYWGLQTAQQWRERLGLERDALWDHVLEHLAEPLVQDGRYAALAVEPFTETVDHPSMLGALGMLPKTPLIERDTMAATLDFVWNEWNWPQTWGWDYPMIAMTAARLGQPERAIDALLVDQQKNRYLVAGYNFQLRDPLPIYLPGNGGLLTAVAMMAAGWDDAPDRHAPGFPDDGWVVRYEKLHKMP